MNVMELSSKGESTAVVKEEIMSLEGEESETEVCFLCLRESSLQGQEHNDRSEEEEVEREKAIHFRNVCRYLEVSPSSVLFKRWSDTLATGDKETGSVKDSFLGVNLCESCTSLTKHLSGLIHQKEVVNMLMKHELGVFQRILMESDQGTESSSLSQWSNIGSSCATPEEGGLVEQLRNETKKKCSEKVMRLDKESFPKVRLRRLNTGNHQENSLPGGSSDSGGLVQDSTINNVARRIDSGKSRPGTQSANTAAKLLLKAFKKYCEQVRPSSSFPHKRFRCQLCKDSLLRTANPYSKSVLLRHLASVHPEKLFAHRKLQNLSEDEFSDRCRQILKDETNQARAKSISLRNPTVLCSICNVKCSDTHVFRYHFVWKHYNILDEKLQKIMSSEKNDSLAQVDSMDDAIPDVLFMEVMPPSSQNEGDSDDFHQTDNESAVEIMELNSTDSPQEIISSICTDYSGKRKQGNKYKCFYCPKFLSQSMYRRHLVITHPENILIFMKNSQLSEIRFSQYCRRILKSEVFKGVKKRSSSQSLSFKMPGAYCIYCKRIVASSYELKYYLVMEHDDVLEEKLRRLQKRESTGNKEHRPVDKTQPEREEITTCRVSVGQEKNKPNEKESAQLKKLAANISSKLRTRRRMKNKKIKMNFQLSTHDQTLNSEMEDAPVNDSLITAVSDSLFNVPSLSSSTSSDASSDDDSGDASNQTTY